MGNLFPIVYFWMCVGIIASTLTGNMDFDNVKQVGSLVLFGETSSSDGIYPEYEKVRMAQTDGPGWTDLHRAAVKGDTAEVQRLIKAGADIEAREAGGGYLPL